MKGEIHENKKIKLEKNKDCRVKTIPTAQCSSHTPMPTI